MSNPTNNNEEFNMSTVAAALNMVDKTSSLNSIKRNIFGNDLDKLSPKIQKRVEVLRQIQSEHDELKAKFLEERRALEDRYQKLYQPFYAKRYDIVNAAVEVDGVPNGPKTDEGTDKAAEEKGVPDFWLNAMKTNEVLAEWIMKHDEEALKYLKDIKWSRIELSKDDPQKGHANLGLKLDFFFDPNPYFTNSVLTKIYYMIDEDEPLMDKATGTVIDWCPGKCLTEKKKKQNKGKNVRPITKTATFESFFDFFSPPDIPDDDEWISDDAVDELQAHMDLDYDIGITIRNKIIPHAVSWFTGEATEDYEFGELDDVTEDEDDDKEDEDEDDDEEDKDEDDNEEDVDEDSKSKQQ